MSDVVSKITIALNDQASSGMKGIGAEVDNLRGKVSSFGSALSNIGTGIGISAGMAGLSGISDVLSEGFSTSLRIENLDATYSAIYDGAAKAKQELAFIRAEADRLGLSFLDTADSAKMFFASSKGSSIEKDAKDIFSAFSELAVTMRLSKEQTSGMFLALGQSASKGKLMAQELREQLGEKVPGIFRVIADSLGVTTTQLDKMLEEGKVGLDALAKAVPVIRERFGSALPEAVNSTTAAIGRLNTKWDDLMAHSANTDMLKAGINGLTAVIGTLDSGMVALSEHSDMLSSVALGLGAGYVALTVKKKLLNQESLTAIKNAVSESSVMGTLKQSVLDAASADFRLAQSHNAAAKAALTQAQRTEERLIREKNILANSFKIVQGETNKAAVLSKMAVLEGRLSGAIKERSAAERTAKAATDALANASKNVNTAYEAVASGGLNKATKGMNLLKTAGTGLMNLFGGPWGVALTAATAGITYLSTRQTEGERISETYAGKQLEVEEAFKRLATSAKAASKETDNVSASQERLDQTKAIKNYKESLKELESLSRNMSPSQFSGMTDSINGVDEVRRKTLELLEAVRTGKGDVMGLAKEIDQLGTQSDAAATLSEKVRAALQNAAKAGREAGGVYDFLAGVLGNVADKTQQAIDAQYTLMTAISRVQLGGMPNSLSEAVTWLDKYTAKTNLAVSEHEKLEKSTVTSTLAMLNEAETLARVNGEYEKAAELAKVQVTFRERLASGFQKETKAAEAAAKKAENAYRAEQKAAASYASEVEKTEASIRSLQAQLATKPGEVFSREQAKIAKEYEATLAKINKEAVDYANKKGITKTQAEELKQSKLQEASLQKNLDLRLAQEKEEKRLADLAKDKYDFYKELEAISGEYGLSLQFQNEMIAAQAKELEHLELPQRYMEQWKELKALQMSHDWSDGAQRAFLQYRADATDAAKGTEEAFSSLFEGMDSGFHNVWQQMLEDGKVSLSSFKSLFASFLADLMHMAITRPITVQIAGAISGLFGSSGTPGGAGAGAGGSGGITDLLSMGTSFLPGGSVTGMINEAAAWAAPSLFSTPSGYMEAAGTELLKAGVTGTAPAATPAPGTFTSSFGAPALGASIGSFASPYVNNLLGLQNNKGSQIGSMIGGLGSTAVLGTMAATNFWNPAGWIAGGLAALSSILGGSIGSLFGGGRKTHASVYGKMEDVGFSRDQQTYIDAFMGGAWYDRAGATEAQPFAQAIGEAASQTAGTILDLAAALPDEYRKSVEDQLASATWDAGRGISGASWNFQWWEEGMAEERTTEAVKDMFEQMGYAANKAFADAGIGDLFDSFDLSTEEGFKKAQTAISAISSITTAIDEIKAPTSEAEQQAKAFVAQMDALGEAVKASGLNAAYADKMIGEYRTAYVDSYVKSLDEMFNPLSEIEQQAKSYKESIDSRVAALTTMSASEAQLAKVRGYTQKAIDSIVGSLDAAFFPLSDVEKQTKSTMELLTAYENALKTLGDTGNGLAKVDEARAKVQSDLLDKVRAYVSTTPEVVSQAAAMNAEFDALHESMLLAGNATAALEELERNRTQALAAMREEYLRSFDQSITQRYGTLNGTSDAVSRAISQENELREAIQKFGEGSAQVAELLHVQAAENVYAAQAKVDALQEQLNQLKAQAIQAEISAINEQLSAAKTLKETWERLSKSLYDSRAKLWTSDADALGLFARRDAAQSEFDRLYTLTMQGDEEAAAKLASSGDTLLSLLKETSANGEQYTAGFWDVEQKLKDAESVAGKQLSEAQKSYNTLESQLKAQQSMLDALGYNNNSLDAINAQIVTVGNQLAKALGNLNAAQSNPNYGGTTSGGGYVSWEDKLLQEKADALNAGQTLAPGQTAGGWTPDKVLSAIKENGWTVADWYNYHGKAEGFAAGGLTPLNEMFSVGEAGKEYMLSPYQYVVLNNSMTRKLDEMQTLYRQTRQPVIDYRLMQMPVMGTDGDATAEIVKLREEVSELKNILRQTLTKTDTISANSGKIYRMAQKWDSDGLPATRTS